MIFTIARWSDAQLSAAEIGERPALAI